MKFTSGSIRGQACRVARYEGIGSLNRLTPRGEVKMYPGDHLVQIDYTRDERPGDQEKGLLVRGGKTLRETEFVVSEDAARALGIWQPREGESTSSTPVKAASPTSTSGTTGAEGGAPVL